MIGIRRKRDSEAEKDITKQNQPYSSAFVPRFQRLLDLPGYDVAILIGRLGQNAEAKTAQNNKEYVALNIPTQESWKDDKGDYETRTEWRRVFAWKNLSRFANTLQKGQLVTLKGILRYRDGDEVKGTTFKNRIAEVHATSLKRLSKVEAADDPTGGADDE